MVERVKEIICKLLIQKAIYEVTSTGSVTSDVLAGSIFGPTEAVPYQYCRLCPSLFLIAACKSGRVQNGDCWTLNRPDLKSLRVRRN